MNSFATVLKSVQDAGEDFEWYPTTDRMIDVVAAHLDADAKSIMDIGAGDGRVLQKLATYCKDDPALYAIEKSTILIQAQPENVVPVGTDLFEQNLACLPVDFIFCNPPYSQFVSWVNLIIESGFAQKAFLVIPRRWKEDASIKDALDRRRATARVIHSDDFYDGVRQARAVIDIVEISYPLKDAGGWRSRELADPFDAWFDANIPTFDPERNPDIEAERARTDLARVRNLDNIHDMVEAYNEEYARMEENYRAIFRLDYAILKELGVNKETIREGIKVKMAGLKSKYWGLLFERLDTVTARLSTRTKERFLQKLTGRSALAFTENNAYAVVLWAIKNANRYFNEQTVQLFRDLSTFDGVANYKSNQRAWQKDGWRYQAEDHDHYALDYRIVVERHGAIFSGGWNEWDYPGHLSKHCHDLIDDIRAVFNNLGFVTMSQPSRSRNWVSGGWQNWYVPGETDRGPGPVLFQVKAFKNGNLHVRFLPDAIKALNVEAGRLLGWLRAPQDVERELGYSAEDAKRFFSSTRLIEPRNLRLLSGSADLERGAA